MFRNWAKTDCGTEFERSLQVYKKQFYFKEEIIEQELLKSRNQGKLNKEGEKLLENARDMCFLRKNFIEWSKCE